MHYQKIFVTNLPAFYKINLFNKIAEKAKILVIFTGHDGDIRDGDFFSEQYQFDVAFLESKSSLFKALELLKILRIHCYNNLVIGGWDNLVLWFAAFYSREDKNEMILESSIHESNTTGIKGMIKKLFLTRISRIYYSGEGQLQLIEALKYDKAAVKTKGVGIFNVLPQPVYEERQNVKQFLYVGRFSEEKNLPFLISTFNSMPQLQLNMVGFGPLEKELKTLAAKNINFIGRIKNDALPEYYRANDVLILPSISEVWGLVVEEALNNGCPVLLSQNVGCADEWRTYDVSIEFDPINQNSFVQALNKIANPSIYNRLRRNVAKLDFEKTASEQAEVYVQNLKIII